MNEICVIEPTGPTTNYRVPDGARGAHRVLSSGAVQILFLWLCSEEVVATYQPGTRVLYR